MRWMILNLADISAAPTALDILYPLAKVISFQADPKTLARELPHSDAYICTLSQKVTGDLLSRCPNLKIICTPSTGTDHIDMAAAKEKNIEIISLRGEKEFLRSITATAELAWALLLAVVRNLRTATRLSVAGIWARDLCRGSQLSDKTFGILGYGRLGQIIAEYARAFRMRVIACDRQPRDYPSWVESVTLDELLKQSDVISVHIHLDRENTRLIGRNEFAKMKRGAVIINTSRGGIIDETALAEALQNGTLAGAGLDVIDGEWNSNLSAHPLIRLAKEKENVVITPHIGGVTIDSQRAAYEFIAKKLYRRIEELMER